MIAIIALPAAVGKMINPVRNIIWMCLACGQQGHVWSGCPNPPAGFCMKHGVRHRNKESHK